MTCPLARDGHSGGAGWGKQRKNWPTDTKEHIGLAVLGCHFSVAEAARQHGVTESLIHTWKAQFLEAGRARVLSRMAPVWGLPASPETARGTVKPS
ncbi:transposase [Deinococcus rhizophilus]|uniref:transposase n=1 Tax=Deinococcus rhizophilus TaxID=3049544 RepID=UPI003898DA85